jgi:hypothetical protein
MMNRTWRIVSFLVILAGLLAPYQVAAYPTAPQITVSPSKAGPGDLVQIKGSGFSINGVPRVYWDSDNTQLPFLGQGTFNSDGSFVINVAVPPDAVSGQHTWWVVSPLRTGGTESASVAFNLDLPNHAAAFIYDTDLTQAQQYKTLLEARGVHITLIPLSSITLSTSFVPYELIIVGYDTGNLTTWGNVNQLLAVVLSGKPVLGIGVGGYTFFGKLSSPIGYPAGEQVTGVSSVVAVNPSDPLFNTPYKIALTSGEVQVFTAPANPFEIPVAQPNSKLYPLGSVPNAATQMDIIQSGRFLLWGFGAGPTYLSSDGIKLFTNTVYYLLGLLKKDTLVLSNLTRMTGIGYASADVTTLENKITELVGLPASTTNMTAVWRDLASTAPASVTAAYNAWGLTSSTLTNNLVTAIDAFVEQLKRGAYPNLRYIILVGSHEVIPMKVRPADNWRENDWAIPAGYMYDLYHSGTNGSYLTDSVYGDLSDYDNGRGVDNVLLPELAVGRLVETPPQITNLISTYIESAGTMSRSGLVAIGSDDYLDGAQAAANAMGPFSDTTLNQDGFASSLVPPKINAKHGVVYIGGHGDFNWMTTQKWGQGFMAGATGTQGDTEELVSLSNAVIVAAGCHNGFNMTNQLYHDYSGTTAYGDFPERLANKNVGVYVGSTGYTWITLSGASKNVADVGFSERLASSFVDHLLNDGMNTAGKAFLAAVSQYMAERPAISTADRRVLAIATFYGIPNYRWQTLFRPKLVKTSYSLWSIYLRQQPAGAAPQAPGALQQVTATINNWTLEDGVVQIAGASYTGDENYPILPVISTSWVLPGNATNVSITLDQQASAVTPINNDVPNAVTGTVIDPVNGILHLEPKTITLTGLYPDPLAYSYTLSSPGGVDTTLAMSFVPVQYNPTTHQTFIWTQLVFDVSYTADANAAVTDGDGDGLPDYWENSYGLDPSSALGDNGAGGDPDHDQLTNQQELQYGTDPLNPDTDHDGALDGLEVQMNTDPLNPGSTAAQILLPLVRR